MPKYTVMVFTRATPGDEAAFDEWYENTHLDDVLKTAPGWTTGRRYSLDFQQGVHMPSPHLALYEAEGDSPEAVVAELAETRPEREISDLMDSSEFAIWVFSESGVVHRVS